MIANFDKIRELVGDIRPEQLTFVDSFVGNKIGIFMPIAGPCLYAISYLHTHPSYSFIIPFNNNTYFVLQDKKIAAEKNSIQCISPEIPHHEITEGDFPRYIVIFIEKEFFERQFQKYAQDLQVFTGQSYGIPESLWSYIKQFISEIESPLPGSKDVTEALNNLLCHTIIRAVTGQKPKTLYISNRIEIINAVEYIHDNIEKKITVQQMSRQANMSQTHFIRVFKKETGKTPNEYLFQARLEKAKKLLMSEENTITEIAIKCGFGSSAYLSDRFFASYQLTPSEYRNNFRNG